MHGNQPGAYGYDGAIPAFPGVDRGGGFSYNSFVDDLEGLLSNMVHRSEVVQHNGQLGGYTTSRWVDTPPRRVQKGDCPYPTNRTTHYDCGEPSITFVPKTHTVVWDVPSNNHAREHGRSHPIAAALFKALGTVTWTRGSGGVIVGNDEYNGEDTSVGGGGNYVIDAYSAAAQKQKALAARSTSRWW